MKIDVRRLQQRLEQRKIAISQELCDLGSKQSALLEEQKQADAAWRALDQIADVLIKTRRAGGSTSAYWSPERRRQQSERMKQQQAKRRMAKP